MCLRAPNALDPDPISDCGLATTPPPFPLFRVPVFRIQSPLPHRYPLTPVTVPLCLSTMGFTLTTHLFSRLEPRCTADSALSTESAVLLFPTLHMTLGFLFLCFRLNIFQLPHGQSRI